MHNVTDINPFAVPLPIIIGVLWLIGVVVVYVDLILLGIWLWKQIKKK